ncbi:nucleoside hydrolase [Pseudogulbenkiania sp. MAI-1]|uniref:nucleoside hydrolase n=1 Tax=Pseudogulbenkiania sp. MAI-1 TaxID=990370 RepID=UPI00045E7F59|nr:nucleoside hydrolase [Pseudogulbenkiania sp. MAI-1]
MSRLSVIFDTDPGLDDAAAILALLGASDQVDLLALTTVAGNVGLPLTSRNARIVCEWAGRPDVPVYAGCEQPLLRPLVTAEQAHGKTGLDGVPIHEPDMPLQGRHAVDFIIDTLRAAPAGTITLCPVGPLTNIALALSKAPDIAPRIKEIVLMGGSYFAGGNISPAAEFNVFVDPEAAAIVLGSGVPLVMLPLDVTHQVRSSAPRLARLRALPNRCGPLAADILANHERHDVQRYGQHGAPMHDPCVVAYLLQPSLFSGRRVNVEVETASALTRGATVVDWWGVSGRAANALYLTEADADGVFALLADCLAKLP